MGKPHLLVYTYIPTLFGMVLDIKLDINNSLGARKLVSSQSKPQYLFLLHPDGFPRPNFFRNPATGQKEAMVWCER